MPAPNVPPAPILNHTGLFWAVERQKAEGYIKLERGFVTISLPGIDEPFDACYLGAGGIPLLCSLCVLE